MLHFDIYFFSAKKSAPGERRAISRHKNNTTEGDDEQIATEVLMGSQSQQNGENLLNVMMQYPSPIIEVG